MRLKNKRTGETGELHFEPDKEYHFTVVTEDHADMMIFKTLAELNAEWEDAPEEPKEYWYIDYDGGIFCSEPDNSSTEKKMISIGNQFESREEAELAVRKLKAWKRLKDNGFKIEGIRYRNNRNYIEWSVSQKVRDDHFMAKTFNDDLHLLFRR